MRNANDLVKLLKESSIAAVENGKPLAVVFGNVTSDEPIEITIEQKLILSDTQLIIPKHLTDHTVIMTVDHQTEVTVTEEGSHSHQYIGEKEFKVNNALKQGENVILLRMQGGQKYYVLDRLVIE